MISLTGIKNNTIENNIINYIGNFLRFKKKSETIKDKIIKDVRALLWIRKRRLLLTIIDW